jgi:hypothetical protein
VTRKDTDSTQYLQTPLAPRFLPCCGVDKKIEADEGGVGNGIITAPSCPSVGGVVLSFLSPLCAQPQGPLVKTE